MSAATSTVLQVVPATAATRGAGTALTLPADLPALLATLQGDAWLAAFPALVLLSMLVARLTRWMFLRDSAWARSAAVCAEPPAGLSPAEAGTLVDNRADMHDLTSMLVDLAVRGHITIEELRQKRLLVFSATDWILRLRTPRSHWARLAAHEQEFLRAIFRWRAPRGFRDGFAVYRQWMEEQRRHAEFAGRSFDEREFAIEYDNHRPGSDTVRLSFLHGGFHYDAVKVRRAIFDGMTARGLYTEERRGVSRWIGSALMGLPIWIILGGSLFLVARLGQLRLDAHPISVVVSIVAAALIGRALWPGKLAQRPFSGRSEDGVRALAETLGFRDFLSRAELGRYHGMIDSPDTFERYLPYAMAFRVEERWARVFDGRYTAPPAWYRADFRGGFDASELTRRLRRMARTAEKLMLYNDKSRAAVERAPRARRRARVA